MKTFIKSLGRFLRWTAIFLLVYMVLSNIHIQIELNKPRGIDDIVDKIGMGGKIIKFIREF